MAITWRSVSGSELNQANSLLQNATQGLGNAFVQAGNTAFNLGAAWDKNQNQLFARQMQQNTDDVINKIATARNAQDIQALQNSGALSAEALRNQFGEQIDVGQVNNAALKMGQLAQNAVSLQNMLQNNSPEAQEALRNAAYQYSQGNYQGARDVLGNAAKGGVLSGDIASQNITNMYGSQNKQRALDSQLATAGLQRDISSASAIRGVVDNVRKDNASIATLNSEIEALEQNIQREQAAVRNAYSLTSSVPFESLTPEEQRVLYNNNPAIRASEEAIRAKAEQRVAQEQLGGGQYVGMIRSQAERFGISPQALNQLIGSESSNNPRAANKNSSARGLGQFTVSTWNEVANELGLPKVTSQNKDTNQDPRFNPESSVLATAHYASKTLRAIEPKAEGLGMGQSSLLKLGHMLGNGGATALLNAAKNSPNKPVSEVLGKNVVEANKSIMQGKTASQMLDWYKRYDSQSNAMTPREAALQVGQLATDNRATNAMIDAIDNGKSINELAESKKGADRVAAMALQQLGGISPNEAEFAKGTWQQYVNEVETSANLERANVINGALNTSSDKPLLSIIRPNVFEGKTAEYAGITVSPTTKWSDLSENDKKNIIYRANRDEGGIQIGNGNIGERIEEAIQSNRASPYEIVQLIANGKAMQEELGEKGVLSGGWFSGTNIADLVSASIESLIASPPNSRDAIKAKFAEISQGQKQMTGDPRIKRQVYLDAINENRGSGGGSLDNSSILQRIIAGS